jgi:hypothetical protein
VNPRFIDTEQARIVPSPEALGEIDTVTIRAVQSRQTLRLGIVLTSLVVVTVVAAGVIWYTHAWDMEPFSSLRQLLASIAP